MSKQDQTSSRRTVLKLLGSTAAVAGGISQLSAAAGSGSTTVETLRGSKNSPLGRNEIEELRNRLVQRDAPTRESGAPRVVLTNLAETVGDSRVLAYNIIIDDSGVPREQFATRDGVADAPGVGTQQMDRLHDRADEMLETARSQSEPSGGFSPREDQDGWSQWIEYGSTDKIHEFEKTDNDARPGEVTFTNSVRKDTDSDHIGARVKCRMKSGRQLCEENNNEAYCTSTVQPGYQNKFAEVRQNWDMPINNTPTEELLAGFDPEGQVRDVTKSRSASIGFDVSKSGPAASVGYSSNVAVPGAEVIDSVDDGSGQTNHEFKVNSTKSSSSKYSAVFEFGSVAEWDPGCGGEFSPHNVLTVNTDFKWGISVPVVNWGDVVSRSKSFTYTTYC